MGKLIDLQKGQRIEGTRLFYIEDVPYKKNRTCRFKCACGNEIVKPLAWVRHLNSMSCGCLKKEILVNRNYKHGVSKRNSNTGAYRSWLAMHQRVRTNSNYEHIVICERWCGNDGFKNFLEDMGERPENYSIERIDYFGNYEPNNCKWASIQEQAINKSTKVYSYKGIDYTLKGLCEISNLTYTCLINRLWSGMSLEEALNKPYDFSKSKKIFRGKLTGCNWNKSHKKWVGRVTLNKKRINLISSSSKEEVINAILNFYKKEGIKIMKDTESIPEDYIFVYASNKSGVHGAGSARTALMNFGAIYGKDKFAGNSYGISTKDEDIQTLPLSEIYKNIYEFLDFSSTMPHKPFKVTQIGCGLAGYKPADIAPLFELGMNHMRKSFDNLYFDTEWFPYLGQDVKYWGTF